MYTRIEGENEPVVSPVEDKVPAGEENLSRR